MSDGNRHIETRLRIAKLERKFNRLRQVSEPLQNILVISSIIYLALFLTEVLFPKSVSEMWLRPEILVSASVALVLSFIPAIGTIFMERRLLREIDLTQVSLASKTVRAN